MKLNDKEYFQAMGDDRKFPIPILIRGDKILLLFDDESSHVPGCKKMKKGTYDVLDVHESYVLKGSNTYDLRKVGSKYVFPMYTIAIDKAINDAVIVILKD